MKSGLRRRLFAVSFFLVALFAVVVGIALEVETRALVAQGEAPAALLGALRRDIVLSVLGGLVLATGLAWMVSGSFRGLVDSFQRLTDDLSRAVSDLTDERNRLQAVLGGLRDAVVALDARGRITLVNPAASRLLGAQPHPEGRTALEAFRAPDLPGLVAEALVGRPATAEFDLRAGRVHRVQATATPQSGGGCVIALRDVTELRQLETVRRDFVANVSHELRTPISALRASAEALSNGAMDDPEAAAAFLAAIERNAERLSLLIDDLLSLSRIEAGHADLSQEHVVLADLIEGVVEAMAPQISARQQRVTLDLAEHTVAVADPRALEQVLTNLLDNAVKYTPEGGHIALRARARGNRILAEVEDNGPGVAPHHRGRLFERFYRVDPGRSRLMGGTGLGLAIVKHLVEAMGGAVGMRPRAPHGSVFWLELPAAPTDQ